MARTSRQPAAPVVTPATVALLVDASLPPAKAAASLLRSLVAPPAGTTPTLDTTAVNALIARLEGQRAAFPKPAQGTEPDGHLPTCDFYGMQMSTRCACLGKTTTTQHTTEARYRRDHRRQRNYHRLRQPQRRGALARLPRGVRHRVQAVRHPPRRGPEVSQREGVHPARR